MLLALASAFAACTACTGSEGTDPEPDAAPDAAPGDADAALDATAEDAGALVDAGPDRDVIQVAAFEGDLVAEDSTDMDAHGGPRVGAIWIEDNVGTIVFDEEEMPAVAYQNLWWELAGIQGYALLGVGAERWVVLFPYCDPASGEMRQVWYESTDGAPVTYEPASGRCTTTRAEATTPVAFPNTRIARPPLLDEFSIDGPRIAFDGAATGTLELAGTTWELLPFNLVDCTEVCGDPGAWELHSILWDAATESACFTIVYLLTPPTDTVWLDFTLCLPSLDRPNGTFPETTYSVP